MKRVGPWLFGIAAAVVLSAFHIHRYTWQYGAIFVCVAIVGYAIGFIFLFIRGRKDGQAEEPAGEVTRTDSVSPLEIRVEREPASSNLEEIFHQPPGSDARPAEGDR